MIRGPQTSDQTLATAVSFVKRLGKFVIVVNDSPGFLVNRMLGRYLNEALEMVAEGASLQLIEDSAKAFGMPVGPLQLYDIVGLDTAFYAGRIMWEAFPDRIKPSPILPALIKAGRLGQKSVLASFLPQPQATTRAGPRRATDHRHVSEIAFRPAGTGRGRRCGWCCRCCWKPLACCRNR